MNKLELIYGAQEKNVLLRALKPCPFCGGAAEMSGMFPSGQFYVQCTGCRANMWYDREDKAIESWNRREQQPDSPEF